MHRSLRSWSNVPGLVLLATIPGLLALGLYYVGLQTTAASRATFAELAFPATAAIVGIGSLNGSLTRTQYLGFGIVVVTITALSWHERRRLRWLPQRRSRRDSCLVDLTAKP